MTVEQTNYPIWNIYFPAVTICSNNKVVESQTTTLLKQQPWKNISEDDPEFEYNFRDALDTFVLFDAEPEALGDSYEKFGHKMALVKYHFKFETHSLYR